MATAAVREQSSGLFWVVAFYPVFCGASLAARLNTLTGFSNLSVRFFPFREATPIKADLQIS